MHQSLRTHTLFVVAVALCAWAMASSAAPNKDLWERWTEHDASSQRQIDHSAWNRFLGQYVVTRDDGPNLVYYQGIDQSAKGLLDGYIQDMSGITIDDYNRDEQMAYWINLYNAVTLKTVLDHYPVDSIREIDAGLFSKGPWDKKLVTVEQQPLTLNDIEHRILRPIWSDPRVHYAVNCASIGCPSLQPVAFDSSKINQQLNAAARQYINSPRGATVEDGHLITSSIYKWFQADFGGNDQGVIEHLKSYADPELKSGLAGVDKIYDTHYDWSLNDAQSAPARTGSRSGPAAGSGSASGSGSDSTAGSRSGSGSSGSGSSASPSRGFGS